MRSLQNIVSKLDHGVVCDSDLVQEKHLHIRLLEWFNFPSCVLQDKVLTLILRLSKVSFFFVAACNSETYHLLYVFVGYAGNIIDEVWQQMSQRGVVETIRNFAGS